VLSTENFLKKNTAKKSLSSLMA
ncbi:putative gTP pyrophosphokinase, partial [Vibrio parahaemolyticus EKP-021]